MATQDQEEREYEVTWVILLSAASAMDAAIEARRIIQDPEGTATIYQVVDVLADRLTIVDVAEGLTKENM